MKPTRRLKFPTKTSLLAAALAVSVAFGPRADAATVVTERRMAEVRAAAAKHKSFFLEIVPPDPTAVARSGATGTIFWMAPHFYRTESQEPVPGFGKLEHVTVCDGQTLWSYYPREKVAYKIDLAALKEKYGEANLLRRGIILSADPFQGADEEHAHFLEETKLDGVACYVFQVPLTTSGAKLLAAQSARLWIGVKDGLLRRQETFSKDGGNLDRINLRVISTDADAPEGAFQLKLPPDCRVEDVTASVEPLLADTKKP
jgi:outer membrane lipoprotein-sorting protein